MANSEYKLCFKAINIKIRIYLHELKIKTNKNFKTNRIKLLIFIVQCKLTIKIKFKKINYNAITLKNFSDYFLPSAPYNSGPSSSSYMVCRRTCLSVPTCQ